MRYVKDSEWETVFPNFRKEEFMCNCKSVGKGISYSLVSNLQKLRNKYGSIHIYSGYRCPKCNASVGGASNSAHLTGQAADFQFDSGNLANQNTRINIVNEIKGMSNYHYSYCNINGSNPGMGNSIHMDTTPVKSPIDKFYTEEVGLDYVKLDFESAPNAFDWGKYSLNGKEYVDLPANGIIRGLLPDTTYKVSITLHNTDMNEWTTSDTIEFTTLKSIEEEKPNENINIPDKQKTTDNKEINTKKSVLELIKEFIINLIKILGGNYDKKD